MGWMTDYLRDSRLAGIVARIERDEPVDWPKEKLLQDLDVAVHGERLLADAIEREEEADEQLTQFLQS